VSSLLPLFPLDLVLLPGLPLPLHVFEPRYKEMITECLEQKKPFGIVRASDEGVASIGCTAEIVSVTKKYDDGRMDILTRGVNRFEVLEVNEERSFLRAEIAMVEDEPEKPASEMAEQAVRLHAEIAKLAGTEPSVADAGRATAGEAAENLSFLLAGSLPLDLDFKQSLLATLSEAKRLEAVVEYLRAILPGLRRAANARWN
jgi:Lon protease-like protein